MIWLIILFLIVSMVVCVLYLVDVVQCFEVMIIYIGSEIVDIVVFGRFQIVMEGLQVLWLLLVSVDWQVYVYVVLIDICDEYGLVWCFFSVVLEEFKLLVVDLVVVCGEIEIFLYDGKGVFLFGVVQKGQVFFIVVCDF